MTKSSDNDNTHFPLYSTNFCIPYHRKLNYCASNALPSDNYTHTISRDEFFLAENIASKRQRIRTLASTIPKSSYMDSFLVQDDDKDKDYTLINVGFNILQKSQLNDIEFLESRLQNYLWSSASAFDVFRPRFDDFGFFPFKINLLFCTKLCINLSSISFRTNFLEFPVETIDHISLYFGLIEYNGKQQELISNIVELTLKLNTSNVWIPVVFREIDMFISRRYQTTLRVDVVASVRVESTNKPFILKNSRIYEGLMNLMETKKGEYVPIENQKIHLQLTKNNKRPDAKHSAKLVFSISSGHNRQQNFPTNFICPTNTVKLYEMTRKEIKKFYNQFTGCFDLFNTNLPELLMLRKICSNDRVLKKLIEKCDGSTYDSLKAAIRTFYSATGVLSTSHPRDSYEMSLNRCLEHLSQGTCPPDVRFKPFNTSELCGTLIHWKTFNTY